MQKVKLKAVGKYHGHNIKSNKAVDLILKLEYSELTKTVQILQLLNENITIAAKVADEKPKVLGMYMVKNIKIDNDGESTIKFTSTLDYVEAGNLNNLAGEILQLLFKANVEVEGDEE